MRRPWAITKRMVVNFYDDQMTQHAAAITYYSLMSLFPAILLGLSILGLVGEYPRTYDAIVRYLDDVAPPSVVRPIDESLRDAFRNKSTATTGLFLSTFLALFGTTGVLESMRRALNVVFRVRSGRSFLKRKGVDILSTFALLTLVLSTLIFVVIGKSLAEDILRVIGADENAAQVWSILRWPAAVASALLGFSFVYAVTPDHEDRHWHLVTPGAALGVTAWLVVSYGLSEYISNVVNIGALYGAFTGAIVVVLWLWFSSCALLLGAELNASIIRQREIEAEATAGGVPHPSPEAGDAALDRDGGAVADDEDEADRPDSPTEVSRGPAAEAPTVVAPRPSADAPTVDAPRPATTDPAEAPTTAPGTTRARQPDAAPREHP